jgi:hypothetical protein
MIALRTANSSRARADGELAMYPLTPVTKTARFPDLVTLTADVGFTSGIGGRAHLDRGTAANAVEAPALREEH